jgi:hypothetical protein
MPPPRDPNPVWPPLRFAPQDRPDDFETKAIEPEAVDAARTDLYEIDPDADDPLSPEALANRQKGHDGDTGVIEVVSSDEPLYNSDDEKDPFYKLAPGSDHPDAQGDRTRLTWSQRMDMGIQAIERGLNRIDDAVPEWVLGPGVAAVVLIFIIAGLMIFLISIKNEEDPKIMAVAMEERTGEAEARARELSTIVMGQATQVAERVDAIEEPEGEPESIVVASKEEPSPTIITTSDPPKDAESVVGEPAEDPAEEPSGPEATEPDPVVEPEPPAVVMTEGPPNEFLEESEPAVEETADEEPEEEPDEDSAAMAASADAGKEAAEELKPASEPEPEEPEPVAEPEPAVVQKPEPKKTKPEPDEPTIVASREEPEQVQEEPRKTTPQVHFVIRGGKVVRTSPEARPVVSYVVRGGKVVRQ